MPKDPLNWKISDIQRLIDNKEKESAYLEFKECKALMDHNKARMKVSKGVSAFANAGGGTIIYGIIEKNHLPIQIDKGFDPEVIKREWLDQIIYSTIHRKIEGIRINQIEMGEEYDDRVLYVISIPQSDRAPHQALDKKFYTRRNFLSDPMEEYEIRDVMLRKKAPDVTLDLYFRRFEAKIPKFPLSVVNPETINTLEINGSLKNEGGGDVQYAIVTLFLDERLNPDIPIENISFKPLELSIENKPIKVVETVIKWGGPTTFPIFNTVEFLLLEKDINIHFKFPWLQEDNPPVIIWNIRAPGMEPNSGFLRIKLDEDNNAYFEKEEPKEISNIFQDGRNREFLKTPDRSIKPDLK